MSNLEILNINLSVFIGMTSDTVVTSLVTQYISNIKIR